MREALQSIEDEVARETCFELVEKLLSNIITNPADEKYRTVKQANKKLTGDVTRHQGGVVLIGLVGFLEERKDSELVWANRGSVSYLKGVRLDLAVSKQS
jgi:hypothetical protein